MLGASIKFARYLLAASMSLQMAVGAQTETTSLRVTGRLLDLGGRPIAKAAFTTGLLHRLTTDDAIARPVSHSGADGRFDITIRSAQSAMRSSAAGLLIFVKGRAAIRWGENHGPFDGTTGAASAVRRFLGDIVIPEGRSLRGQITGHKGVPLAGATVRAIDLADLNRSFPFQTRTFTATKTEADGRFTLRGVTRGSIALLVNAEGYYDRIVTSVNPNRVAILSLRKSGFVSGQLVRADGEPTRGTVFADYEGYQPCCSWEWRSRRTTHDSHMPCQALDTAEDGSFRMTIRYPGFFRLFARGRFVWHEVVEERVRHKPAQRVRLELPATASSFYSVRAVDADTGKPILAIAGAAYWPKPGHPTTEHSMIVLAGSYETLRADASGLLRLPGPPDERGAEGLVHVLAAGYAPRFLPKITWPGGGKRELEVKMTRESRVSGSLVGPEQSVQGISVTCSAVLTEKEKKRGVSRPTANPKTGRGGAFTFRGLGAGRYTIATHYTEGKVTSAEFALRAREQKTGMELVIPNRIPITCNVTSKADLQLCHFELGHGASADARWFRTVAILPIPEDGVLRLPGQPPGYYRISLRMPDPHRFTTPKLHALATFKLSDKDPKPKLTIPKALFTRLAGKLIVENATVPMHRFVVAALDPATDMTRPMFGDSNPRARLARWQHVALQPDGSFALRLFRGTYVLRVVDAVTGMVLHTTEPRDLAAKDRYTWQLHQDLTPVSVVLRGPGGSEAECTSIRIHQEDVQADPAPKGRRGRFASSPPKGKLLWVGDRPGSVRLFLPAGSFSVVAGTGLLWLFRSSRASLRWERGRKEFAVRPGKPMEIVLDVERVSDESIVR